MKLHDKITGVILLAYIFILDVVDMSNINSMCEKPLLNSSNYDIYCLGKFPAAQVIIRWENSSPQVGAHLTYCLKTDSYCGTEDTQNNTQIRMYYNGTQLLLYMHGDHIISCTYTSNGIHELVISTTMEMTHVMYTHNGVIKNYWFPYKVNEPNYKNVAVRNSECIGLYRRKTGGDKVNYPVCKELQSSDQLLDLKSKGYKHANLDWGEKNTNNDGRSPSPEVPGGAIKDTIGITESRIWNGFMIVLLILILIVVVSIYRYIKRHWNTRHTSPKEATNSTDTVKTATHESDDTQPGSSAQFQISPRKHLKGKSGVSKTETESSDLL